MATVAVFIALGGTSYAVATNSIGSRQVKNNSIRGVDIRDNSRAASGIGKLTDWSIVVPVLELAVRNPKSPLSD
jgi:hypothetical protein